MHAKTALPCAWALGTLVVLTGCASRGSSTTHPLDRPVAPSLVASTRPPALRAPSPPSVLLLDAHHAAAPAHRAVPLQRDVTVQPALAAPVLRTQARPAPCALPPELSVRRPLPRAAAGTFDVPALIEQARRRGCRRDEPSPCAGGT
jgi:hypothetical protein